MSAAAAVKRQWWRVVIAWTLEGGEETRYAYVTKDTEQMAIFSALNDLIVSSTLAVGDTVTVLSCDPHAYERGSKTNELQEVP